MIYQIQQCSRFPINCLIFGMLLADSQLLLVHNTSHVNCPSHLFWQLFFNFRITCFRVHQIITQNLFFVELNCLGPNYVRIHIKLICAKFYQNLLIFRGGTWQLKIDICLTLYEKCTFYASQALLLNVRNNQINSQYSQ